MKKILLSIITIFAFASSSVAQNWNMYVTHEDGTVDTLRTTAVKNVSFKIADQHVDRLIIKELYCGGCPNANGDKGFQFDKGIVLYNNSADTVCANNLAFAVCDPANAFSPVDWYENGKLIYESEDYLPAAHGIWYFPSTLVVMPYSQVVISVNGAINNTLTQSKSVNYANKDYYAMYDPESGYNHRLYYPSPAEEIPTSHYLKAVEYGMGNGWILSVSAPAVMIFQSKGMTPDEFAQDQDRRIYPPKYPGTKAFACAKLPTDWVIDGIEVFSTDYPERNKKRLTPSVDAGSVWMTKYLGHTLYRNVDKEATLAISGNNGKIVYNYSMGVTTGDPSGIDAEASIKNGAHIVYLDTDNSSVDFHERKEFSIRGK